METLHTHKKEWKKRIKPQQFKRANKEGRKQLCNAYTGAKKRNRAEAFPVPTKKRNHKFRSQGYREKKK